jgi:hypothetical protein
VVHFFDTLCRKSGLFHATPSIEISKKWTLLYQKSLTLYQNFGRLPAAAGTLPLAAKQYVGHAMAGLRVLAHEPSKCWWVLTQPKTSLEEHVKQLTAKGLEVLGVQPMSGVLYVQGDFAAHRDSFDFVTNSMYMEHGGIIPTPHIGN